MPLTVLGIGYTLAPVGPDAVGGAEQILAALDRALVEAGHHSIVVGTLRFASSRNPGRDRRRCRPTSPMTSGHWRARGTDERSLGHCAEFRVDVVHSHALDFADTCPKPMSRPW